MQFLVYNIVIECLLEEKYNLIFIKSYKMEKELERDGSVVKNTGCFTTIYHSKSRGPNAFFWPLNLKISHREFWF